MKTNRNDPCPCGSGKKHKNCCEKVNFKFGNKNKYIRFFVSATIIFFIALTFWGVVEYFSSEHPEMEAYKCDNPNCGLIHYRPISKSN